jgi:hypothetical protein
MGVYMYVGFNSEGSEGDSSVGMLGAHGTGNAAMLALAALMDCSLDHATYVYESWKTVCSWGSNDPMNVFVGQAAYEARKAFEAEHNELATLAMGVSARYPLVGKWKRDFASSQDYSCGRVENKVGIRAYLVFVLGIELPKDELDKLVSLVDCIYWG